MCVCMVSARCNFMLVTRLPSVKSNVASWRIPQLGDSSKEKRPGWVPTGYPDDVPPKKKLGDSSKEKRPGWVPTGYPDDVPPKKKSIKHGKRTIPKKEFDGL